MTLTWPIVLAVLCGAILHAAWNAMIKSGSDKGADTALVTIAGAVIALPTLLWAGLPHARSGRSCWPRC